MTRHSSKRKPPRRFGFVKVKGTTKSWRNVSNPDFAKGATISDRKMSDMVREKRLGVKVSKEKYTKGVKAGTFVYDAATALRQRHAADGRFLNQFVPEMTRADRQVAFKWFDLSDKGERNPSQRFDRADRQRFKDFFKRYSTDAVRQAFGSEPRDVGAFSVTA